MPVAISGRNTPENNVQLALCVNTSTSAVTRGLRHVGRGAGAGHWRLGDMIRREKAKDRENARNMRKVTNEVHFFFFLPFFDTCSSSKIFHFGDFQRFFMGNKKNNSATGIKKQRKT